MGGFPTCPHFKSWIPKTWLRTFANRCGHGHGHGLWRSRFVGLSHSTLWSSPVSLSRQAAAIPQVRPGRETEEYLREAQGEGLAQFAQLLFQDLSRVHHKTTKHNASSVSASLSDSNLAFLYVFMII